MSKADVLPLELMRNGVLVTAMKDDILDLPEVSGKRLPVWGHYGETCIHLGHITLVPLTRGAIGEAHVLISICSSTTWPRASHVPGAKQSIDPLRCHVVFRSAALCLDRVCLQTKEAQITRRSLSIKVARQRRNLIGHCYEKSPTLLVATSEIPCSIRGI